MKVDSIRNTPDKIYTGQYRDEIPVVLFLHTKTIHQDDRDVSQSTQNGHRDVEDQRWPDFSRVFLVQCYRLPLHVTCTLRLIITKTIYVYVLRA